MDFRVPESEREAGAVQEEAPKGADLPGSKPSTETAKDPHCSVTSYDG